MACLRGSVTMILDVSTRYLSDTATLGYYDDLLPFHLSPPTDLSHFYAANEMPCTYGDAAFHPFSKSLTSPSQLLPSAAYSSSPQIIPSSAMQIETSCAMQGLSIPGPRTSTFYRSASIADLQAGKRMQNFESNRTGLRRAPRSIYDLRTCAEQQGQTARSGQHLQLQPTQKPHLQHWLPTPTGQTEYEQRRTRRKFQYKSYQDLHILSMYQENGSLLSLNSIRQPQSATIESGSEASASNESSPQSSPRPQTPVDSHFTCQTSWNKDTRADQERLRRIDARQVHVIEHDLEADESEDEIVSTFPDIYVLQLTRLQKQATVLIGPGKPRLIQIHRPIRPCNSPALRHHNNHSSGLEPVTPTHGREESASLFSSCSTSTSCDACFSNISTPTTTDKRIPTARRQFKEIPHSNMHTSTGSIPPRKLSVSSGSTILSLNGHNEPYFTDPFGDHWSQTSSIQSCNTSILDDGSPHAIRAATESKQFLTTKTELPAVEPHQAELHYQSLISAIRSTDEALDALASRKFDLTSPILTCFRQNPPSAKSYTTADYVLIAHLNKIFSQSSLSSLSVLAAWLVIDAHFVNLFSSAPATPHTDSEVCVDQEDALSQQHHTKLPRITVSAATSPTFSVRPQSRTLISTPLYASSIPSKARSILGIPNGNPVKPTKHTTPSRCDSQLSTASTLNTSHTTKSSPSQSELRCAEGKARIVHSSVQVIGRKLVADLLAEKNKPTNGRKSGTGHKKGRTGAVNGSAEDDVAVSALWEACRCIASLE